MTSAYDVNPNELIKQLALKLKEYDAIKPPAWSGFVKTGAHKQRPPVQRDWWFTRCAAILRSVYVKGPIGVEKLRTKYGGRRDMGVKPEKFYKGSGAIIRKCLQQLEASGLITKVSHKKRKGREVTSKGMSLIDRIASELAKKTNSTSKSGGVNGS